MKKLLFVLSLFAFASAFAQVNFTVIKKDGVAIVTVTGSFSKEDIEEFELVMNPRSAGGEVTAENSEQQN
jgi:hypothetical protein